MEPGFKNFTELEVWKSARVLKNMIWECTKTFPSDERFRLTDQVIRSSRSVSATIAEGHGRFTYKDQLSYCMVARGSLYETLNHLIDANDCGYITSETFAHFKQTIDETGKLLNGYISFLRSRSPDKKVG